MAEYKIQKGDTLSALAKKYGVSVQDFMGANPQIKDPNKIYAGESLNIPAKKLGVSEWVNIQQRAFDAARAEGKDIYQASAAAGAATAGMDRSAQQSSGYSVIPPPKSTNYSLLDQGINRSVSSGSSGSMGGGDTRTVYAGSFPSGGTPESSPDPLLEAARSQASLAQQAFNAQQALVPGEQSRILEAQGLIKAQAAGVDPKLASAGATAQSSLQQALQGLQQNFQNSFQTIAPFAQSGLEAINKTFGLAQQPISQATTFQPRYAKPLSIVSPQLQGAIQQPQLAQMPSEEESISQLQSSPAFQFQMQQGQKVIERSTAARGLRNSGSALKELAQFSQGLASQELGALRQRQLSEVSQYNQSLLSRYGQDVSQNVAANQAALNQAGLIAQQGQFNVGQMNQGSLAAAQLSAQQQQFNASQQLSGLQTQLGALQGISGLGAQAAGAQFGGQQQSALAALGAQTGMAGSLLQQAGQAEQLKTQALTGLIPSLKIGGTF